jgi:hypothetical protein
MKKNAILAILTGLILIAGYIGYIGIKPDTLHLTDEEKQYVLTHQNDIFNVGYFPTDSERRFSEKFCQQVEADTGLKLNPYEASWGQSLDMLKTGTLPIVMNMNVTAARSAYTDFTASFAPISCGIYSSEFEPIDTFSGLKGKAIGIERGNVLAEAFTENYPTLAYALETFDSQAAMRDAFSAGKIDGFISIKDFDENSRDLHYFEIESISQGTNHVGVNKQDPILYRILAKEVDYLKKQNWDVSVSDLIGFELERSQIVFSEAGEAFLEENSSLRVGIPSAYFLYYTGDSYSPKGILPTLMAKIAFTANTNIYYTFDSAKNLRLREDIDFYLDNVPSPAFQSNVVFENEIVAIGSADQKAFSEIYELAERRIGILGVPNLMGQLQAQMPNIALTVFSDVTSAERALKNNQIDYLALPKDYYAVSSLRNRFIERGDIAVKANFFISKQAACIDILNACLAVIDADKILQAQRTVTARISTKVKLIAALVLVILALIAFNRGWKWLKSVWFYDNVYHLGNLKVLARRMKHAEGLLCLLEIKNTSAIKIHYGKKRYDKYIRALLDELTRGLDAPDAVFYRADNQFIIQARKRETLETLYETLHKKIHWTETMLNYQIAMCSADFVQNDVLGTMLTQLDAGIEIAASHSGVYHFDAKQQLIYKNKRLRDEQVKEAIRSGDIGILNRCIVDKQGTEFARYILPTMAGMLPQTFMKYTEKLELGTSLNKETLKKLLNASEQTSERYLLEIYDETIKSSGFLAWAAHLNNHRHQLYFAVSMEAYLYVDAFFEVPEDIYFVIKDFGRDLKNEIQVAHYPVSLLLLDFDITEDSEGREAFLQFIQTYAAQHEKKCIVKMPSTINADYLIEEAAFESINR